MSAPINDGGPAFPTQLEAHDPGATVWYMQQGMSLRDWFAAQYTVPARDQDGSMLGYTLLNLREVFQIQKPPPGDVVAWLTTELEIEARVKYMHADAMLKARKEEKP